MKETKIIVTIDKNGQIKSETKGIKGPSCVDELEELFKDIAHFDKVQKTDEYYQEEITTTKTNVKRG